MQSTIDSIKTRVMTIFDLDQEKSEVKSCLICGGYTTAANASVAAFVVRRCGFKTDQTFTRYCPTCDFAFFQRRLSGPESAALYRDYRGDSYNHERIECEPSYKDLIGYLGEEGSEYYKIRVDLYRRIFSTIKFEANSVLDFGGDGRIPKILFPDASVFIDDLSAGKSMPANAEVDLIFASNVLEHLSDPVGQFRPVLTQLKPGGAAFIDVPKEYVGKLKDAIPTGGAVTCMHEHINHFSMNSLASLCKVVGLDPVLLFSSELNLICAFARKI